MTQDELAGLLGIGRPTIGQFERGTRFPSTPHWRKMAAIFGISIDELMGRDSDDAEESEELEEQEEQNGQEKLGGINKIVNGHLLAIN